MKLLVKPIYGYGWSDGNQTIDVPPPFELEITATSRGEPFGAALGELGLADHPLSGKWICLSPRRAPYDGDCNLFAFNEMPDITKPLSTNLAVSGFASVQMLD